MANSPPRPHTSTDPLPVVPTTPPPFQPPTINKDVAAGFTRAIQSLQGAVPAAWRDAEGAASVLSAVVPRLTVARVIVWCRENGQQLEIVAARVLTDALATEPGLLELTPAEAAEDGGALVQSLWPQGAFLRKQPPPTEQSPEKPDHPVLSKLRYLGEQWHRLSILPAAQAKQAGPTAWRAKVIGDIARAKAEGLQVGLTRIQMLAALEAAGDRWVWEVPPPARDYSLDEFGEPPRGMEMEVAPAMPPV